MSRYRPISVTRASDLSADTMAAWQQQANRYGTAYGVFIDPKYRQPYIEFLKPEKTYLKVILPKGKTIEDFPLCTLPEPQPTESQKPTQRQRSAQAKQRRRELSSEQSKQPRTNTARASSQPKMKSPDSTASWRNEMLQFAGSMTCLLVYLPENANETLSYRFVRLKSGEFITVDVADLPLMAGRKWTYYASKGYVGVSHQISQGRTALTLLHRHLLGITEHDRKSQVIHKDGDKFNFRRENLEFVSRSSRQKDAATFDPQEGVEHPRIPLDNTDLFATVDRADYETLGRLRWRFCPMRNAAIRWDGTIQRHVSLQAVILGTNGRIRFRNGARLDCRRSNLLT